MSAGKEVRRFDRHIQLNVKLNDKDFNALLMPLPANGRITQAWEKEFWEEFSSDGYTNMNNNDADSDIESISEFNSDLYTGSDEVFELHRTYNPGSADTSEVTDPSEPVNGNGTDNGTDAANGDDIASADNADTISTCSGCPIQ